MIYWFNTTKGTKSKLTNIGLTIRKTITQTHSSRILIIWRCDKDGHKGLAKNIIIVLKNVPEDFQKGIDKWTKTLEKLQKQIIRKTFN